MVLEPDKSLLGRVTQSIPEFLSIAHAIDNDFHLRPSLLRRADAHSAAMEVPAHPITVSLRSDAAEAPTTRSDCRKRSVPENLRPEAFLHS
jgi:hypothetical protein